ncbi:MAG: hypothetical protein GX977_03705 [Firmicutes bacterium]|jgi:hypothetical protein|nr:hypothetical protein [Bacillota bacterium]
MNYLIDQLNAGYLKVVGLYQQLSILAQSMATSLERGKWEGVHEQLREKQVIMDTIDAKEAELSQVRERLKQKLGLEEFSLSALPNQPSVSELNATIAQLLDVIGELQKWEKNNEGMLQKLVEDVQGQIEDFSLSKRAAKAYSPRSERHGEARFVDEKK